MWDLLVTVARGGGPGTQPTSRSLQASGYSADIKERHRSRIPEVDLPAIFGHSETMAVVDGLDEYVTISSLAISNACWMR